ncbi:N-acetylneuraminate synthase [Thalassotalea agariperforans]
MTTLIIAEAGVNHNGSVEMAFKLVDAAVKSGVDIVKFQTFKSDLLASEDAEQAQYQVTNSGKKESQQAMLKKLELSFDQHLAVKTYCQQQGIEYLSTAFDFDSLDFLVKVMKLTKLKIPSGEITNAPFILAHALTGTELIVSTGMADLSEIEFALSVIAFGLIEQLKQNENKQYTPLKPCAERFKQALTSQLGQQLLAEKVSLLHCTTEYPAPLAEVNLNAMDLMATTFSLPVGYSDHTEGLLVSIAAVAKGAHIIEKHFTLDRSLPGPDHQASIEPDELTELVKNIRAIDLALGEKIKMASPSEKKNIAVARKSIFAARTIKQGEVITADDIVVMRPGDGLSAAHYYDVIGNRAIRDFSIGESLAID